MSSSQSIISVEQSALSLQKRVLEKCVAALKGWNTQFWVFVHLRSIALTELGRRSEWKRVGEPCVEDEDALMAQALDIQYKLEPGLRTYNELLISRGSREAFQRVSFSFGSQNNENISSTSDVIHLNQDCIVSVTDGLTFPELWDKSVGTLDNKKQIKLAQDRLALSLNTNVRNKFNFGLESSDNPLQALPDEIRYSLQVLMLWSNTLKWRFIETHHSPTQFDALSGLVITVCSCSHPLTDNEITSIRHILQAEDKELDVLVRRKAKLLPRNLADESRLSRPTPQLERRLFSQTANFDTLWEGRDAFYFIEVLRRDLFASTFEGTPESYSFIFGHPGFIARPEELQGQQIKLSEIKLYREWCEGALDRLNVIDVLGNPHEEISETIIVPTAFPVWASQWDDTEQALGSALEKLSSVHQEMIIVGMICRNVIIVFKAGELICSFDGSWKEIRPWYDVVNSENFDIPAELADQFWIKEIYRILTRIAYGPLSRSIIVGYAQTEENMRHFEEANTQNVSLNGAGWHLFKAADKLESYLMRATKTDGAILVYAGANNALYVRNRVRVVAQGSNNQSVSGGTGTVTAQAMAKEGNGILSMKVSRDGGMKIWWNGRDPIIIGIPVER
jgi:hypothetical protein